MPIFDNTFDVNCPLVSIIILNYNANAYLEKCIQSIIESNYKNFEIIVVDNASSDKSHVRAKEKYPFIKLIQNDKNLGYCEGNNIGIRNSNGEFLIILNPDTTVEREWLNELINAYKKNGDGLYQPKLLASDEKTRINTAGNMIQFFGFGYSRGKGEKDNGQFDMFEEIGYASGACLFTTKKIMEELGLFDDFLFAYHDDLDLGWRAAQVGVKSYYVPKSIVYHAESFSFKWSSKKFFLLERNRLYCILTHYSRKNLFKMLPSLLIIEIFMWVFFISKKMLRQKFATYIDLIKNRKLVNSKYKELEEKKTVRDKIIIQKFQNKIEVPEIVTSGTNIKNFNLFLSFLSKISRTMIR